jgi:Fic family protein
MNKLLDRIEELKKEIASAGLLSAEQKRKLDLKIRLEFNYNSNHIEGNTLTYGETELLLIQGKTQGNHDFREYEELTAHDQAFKQIQEYAADSERELTEVDVKNLNRILLIRPFWKEAQTASGEPTRREIIPGNYKQYPNSVRLATGEMHHYASPEETPAQMKDLMEWLNQAIKEGKQSIPKIAALFHYKFVCIHPFDDGNGRIARLLMNYILLRYNYAVVIIKSKDKSRYLDALQRADAGFSDVFIEYILEQLIWSLELKLRAANNESLEGI